MSDVKYPALFGPNRLYGKGVFRRHISLTKPSHNSVLAALEDDCHAVQILLKHDNINVTEIEAKWHRYPLTSCTGAVDAIQSAVGCPLSTNILAPRDYFDSKQNCTHISDLTCIAIVHASRNEDNRLYEVEVTDAQDGVSIAGLLCNGRLEMEWTIKNSTIVAPNSFAGRSPTEGLSSWARNTLDLRELEYCIILQMSAFVAVSRLFDLNSMAGQNAASSQRQGTCFATQPERFNTALRLASQKDFTNTVDTILKFIK